MTDSPHPAPAGDRNDRDVLAIIMEHREAYIAACKIGRDALQEGFGSMHPKFRSGASVHLASLADRLRELPAAGSLSSGETPADDTPCATCGFPEREHRIGYARSRCFFQPAPLARETPAEPTCDCTRLRERLTELRAEMIAVAALFGIEPCDDDKPPTWTDGEKGSPSLVRMLRPFAAPPATEPGDAPSDDVEELTEIIWWLLGERDEFPSPPDDLTDVIACGRKERRRPGIEDKPIRLYWWRGALRGRFDNWARNYHERQARRASRAGGTV